MERASSFTDAMYAASARLTAAVCGRYGIPVDRAHIIGHVEVPGTDHRPRAVLGLGPVHTAGTAGPHGGGADAHSRGVAAGERFRCALTDSGAQGSSHPIVML